MFLAFSKTADHYHCEIRCVSNLVLLNRTCLSCYRSKTARGVRRSWKWTRPNRTVCRSRTSPSMISGTKERSLDSRSDLCAFHSLFIVTGFNVSKSTLSLPLIPLCPIILWFCCFVVCLFVCLFVCFSNAIVLLTGESSYLIVPLPRKPKKGIFIRIKPHRQEDIFKFRVI